MPTPFCRHVRVNGRRCQSPALTGKVFCYYHGSINDQHRKLHQVATHNEPTPVHLPHLHDAESVQIALSILLRAIGENTVDLKRAGTMLYGLQVASKNVRNLAPPAGYEEWDSLISDVVLDEAGNQIAPDEDPPDLDDDEDNEEDDDSEAETDDGDLTVTT